MGCRARLHIRTLVLAVLLLSFCPPIAAQDLREGQRWIGTWATAVMARPPQGPNPQVSGLQSNLNIKEQTLRQIVHVSLGGDRVRVVFSNTFGTEPLAIGAAAVARHQEEASIVEGSVRRLMFNGKATATVPAGAVVVSDPVDLTVPPVSNLVIDLFLSGDTAASRSPVTIHASGHQTNYLSAPGDHTGATRFPVQATTRFIRGGIQTSTWFYLARVEVVAAADSVAVVTIGDSTTDGHQSGLDANNRWPDHLARRLVKANKNISVLNVGVGGNRVLSDNAVTNPKDNVPQNAQARFDRDVLAQPGVAYVIVLEGINDIGGARGNPSPSAEDLIEGHRQLIQRAHANGLKIFGATLTPFEGAAYWTPEGEAKRQALNTWIRTSKMYDAVFDFDLATRDPMAPTKCLPQYDPGDHLHPNGAGYAAMADAIDLTLFRTASAAASRTTR